MTAIGKYVMSVNRSTVLVVDCVHANRVGCQRYPKVSGKKYSEMRQVCE